MVHDEPWEGDGFLYHNILRDGDRFRMYYMACQMLNPEATEHNTGAYAESSDGLNKHLTSWGSGQNAPQPRDPSPIMNAG